MNDQIEAQETEEQAAARIRRVRARRALTSAPEVAHQLRWDAIPLDGHTERGELTTDRTPLLTGVTDAADYLYVRLHGWTEYWAALLQIDAPTGWLWRNYQESHKSQGYADNRPMGFRADTTPEEASHLVSSVASWLLWHETDMIDLLDVEQERYELDIADTIWKLRAAAGLIPAGRRTGLARTSVIEHSRRPCPECHKEQVQVEFFGEPMEAAEARGEDFDPADEEFHAAIAGVTVECAACHWRPNLRPSTIAKWLTPDAVNPKGPVGGERPILKREGDRNWRPHA